MTEVSVLTGDHSFVLIKPSPTPDALDRWLAERVRNEDPILSESKKEG